MSNSLQADYTIPPKRQKMIIIDKDEQEKSLCVSGPCCYRTNAIHAEEDEHPSKEPNISGNGLPPCEFGAECLDKNLLHFAIFYHPVTSIKNELSNSQEDEVKNDDSDVDDRPIEQLGKDEIDTCVVSDGDSEADDYEQNECFIEANNSEMKSMRNDTVFERGPSILRSYSILTEEERKNLIRRAFEMKQILKQRLSDTEDVLKTKTEELKELRMKLDKNLLMVDGEKEAMEQNKLVYFSLYPQRKYREDSAAQIHFRLAESQFYRLLPAGSNYKVTKVDYVVQPSLINRFRNARKKLRDIRGIDSSLPVLGFHGTLEKNIESICETGFRVPGEEGFEHATDPGWYGKGVYFSEYPKYSMNYIVGSSKLLLCQVLPGRVYRCKCLLKGEPLKQGFDSHMSPDGKEVVIFNSHHILPSYIVYYAESEGDFVYEQDE